MPMDRVLVADAGPLVRAAFLRAMLRHLGFAGIGFAVLMAVALTILSPIDVAAWMRQTPIGLALVAISLGAARAARWWAEVFGVSPRIGPEGLPRWLPVPDAPFDVWKFVGVPEPKTVKNRRHWDLWCDDVPALVDHGATLLRAPDDDVSWHVLADPEGNEFCAFGSDQRED